MGKKVKILILIGITISLLSCEVAKKLIDKFWPGPLTLILEKSDIIPNETSANLNTVGIRMPNSPIALSLIKASNKMRDSSLLQFL